MDDSLAGLDSQELLEKYRAGKSGAARELFDRYVTRLIALTRARISPGMLRRVDPEDVVQSAYRSFFARAAGDAYVLKRAGDLWRLLASITLHKLYRQVERQTAARRDLRREIYGGDALNWGLELESHDPTPPEVAALMEQMQTVMVRLSPETRRVLASRLRGSTIAEISAESGRSERTIRRLLQAVRLEFESELLGWQNRTLKDGSKAT